MRRKRTYPGSFNRFKQKKKKFSLKKLWIIPVLLVVCYFALFLLVVPEREDVAFFHEDQNRPLVIAHRGGAGLAPENTLVAFQKALNLGVDVLEFDVQMTKDGHLVVIHDETVDRTTNGEGKVAQLTLEELKSLDAGYRYKDIRGHYIYRGQGVTIPTVEEVFQEFPDALFNIELKTNSDDEEDSSNGDSPDIEVADKLWALIDQYQVHDQVVVLSFSEHVMDRFIELSQGKVALSASKEEAQRFVFYHKLFLNRLYRPKADVLQLPPRQGIFDLKSERLLNGAQRLNMKLFYWTVNEEALMRELLALNVDGIVTDRPDLLIRVMNEMGEFDAEN